MHPVVFQLGKIISGSIPGISISAARNDADSYRQKQENFVHNNLSLKIVNCRKDITAFASQCHHKKTACEDTSRGSNFFFLSVYLF
jgi:hypothetical protein